MRGCGATRNNAKSARQQQSAASGAFQPLSSASATPGTVLAAGLASAVVMGTRAKFCKFSRGPAVHLRAGLEDFKVGDVVTGKVSAIKGNLVCVAVPGLSNNAIATGHLLEKYLREYEVGEEFVAWVGKVDFEKGNLLLSQKPLPGNVDRMAAKLSIGDISKMINEEMGGVVTSCVFFGVFIDIGVRNKDALAPKVRLPDGKLPKDYAPGQKVQCWVVSADEDGKKIEVSLVAPPEGEFPQFKAGDAVTGKVGRIESQKKTVLGTQIPLEELQPDTMEAKISVGDISKMINEEVEGVVTSCIFFGIFIDIGVADKDALAPKVRLPHGKLPKDYAPGQKVQCWVVSADEDSKKIEVSLVAPPEGGFPQFKAGDAVTGKVRAIKSKYLLIEVPGLSRNAVAQSHLLEKYRSEYKAGEEFVAQVAKIDSQKKNVLLTQIPFEEPKPDAMEAKFSVGDISKMINEEVEGIVMNWVPFGVFIDIGVRNKQALAPKIRLPDGKLPKDYAPGQKVQCWVVSADEDNQKIEVSLVAPPGGDFTQPS